MWMFTIILALIGIWLESWSDDRVALALALGWTLLVDIVVGLHVWNMIYPT